MFFCFPIYLPNDSEKTYPTKQRCYCKSLSCNLLPQLIDNSATKGFFFVDRQLSYSSLSRYSWVLAANDCWFQVKYFLQRSSSFSLASASRVLHDNESWHARQRAYLRNTYNLNSYDSGTLVRGLMCTQKNRTTTLVVDRLSFFRSFFIKSPSREPLVLSISETTSHKTHFASHEARSPRLAPQCLAFP